MSCISTLLGGVMLATAVAMSGSWWSCAEGSSVKGGEEMIRVSASWPKGVRVVL